MKLYHYWRSSSSWRVRWALELKGISAEMIHVGLLDGSSEKPEHLERNPLGQVPVLEVDGRYLIESLPIIEWLDENHPRPMLISGDSFQKQRVRALCEIINANTQPFQNPTVVEMVSKDEKAKKDWTQYYIRRGLHAYDEMIKPFSAEFSVGSELSAADLFLIPQCYAALRFGIDLKDEFSVINRIYERCRALDSCKAAEPERYEPK
ncbi:MAG: maleylacetoacetate isomerase [Bacteriovoracia bacterium]